MIIVYTENHQIQKISIGDIKRLEINFKGWYCPIINHVMICRWDGSLKSGVCGQWIFGNPKNPWWNAKKLRTDREHTCSWFRESCACGSDINSPKAINEDVYHEFIKISKTYLNDNVDIPLWQGNTIIALSEERKILDTSFEFHLDMGKKCNFDCSYCPPHIHDNHSPFMSWEKFEQAFDLVSYVEASYKECVLTGGEPTLYEKIIDLVTLANSKGYRCRINTNGTASLSTYQKLLDLGSILSFSLHSEFTNDKVLNKIKKIIDTNPEKRTVFIKVKLMNFGKEDFNKKVLELFPMAEDNPIVVKLPGQPQVLMDLT